MLNNPLNATDPSGFCNADASNWNGSCAAAQDAAYFSSGASIAALMGNGGKTQDIVKAVWDYSSSKVGFGDSSGRGSGAGTLGGTATGAVGSGQNSSTNDSPYALTNNSDGGDNSTPRNTGGNFAHGSGSAAAQGAPGFCCSGPLPGMRSWSEIKAKFWDDTVNDPLILRVAGSFGSLTMWSIGQVTGDQGAVNGAENWMRNLGSAGDGVQMAIGLGFGGRLKAGVPGPEFVPSEAVTEPYVRPSGAGPTAAQRASVQGKPCVDCGALTSNQVADHRDPLVVQHYRTGSVDVQQQRSVDAVQPHCPACSAAQGGQLSVFSKLMKDYFGF